MTTTTPTQGAGATGGPRADRVRNDDRILAVAAQLLARDAGVTMQQIADAAGVARLTVYRRYPDRDALVTALRAAVDRELAEALTAVPDWGEGVDVMAALVRGLASVAVRYPVARLRYAPVPSEPPAIDARVVAILRAGQRTGHLRDDLPAELLHAVLFGVLSSVLDERAQDDFEPAADAVLALLLPGLRPQPAPRSGDRP